MSNNQAQSTEKTPLEVVSEFLTTYSVASIEGLLIEVFERYSLNGPGNKTGISGPEEKVAILFDDLVFLVEALHGAKSEFNSSAG